MSEISYFPFELQPENVKEKVSSYWTRRAEGFYRQRQDEVSSGKAACWLHELEGMLPKKEGLHILDAGCGAGFFEVILGRAGHRVVGIDLTEEMIVKAEEMLQGSGLDPEKAEVHVMDAEKTSFADRSFDAVITRNLTWTLPHPALAYAEWFRVLKPGGVLLNFDAEYAKGAHNLKSPLNRAHRDISDELKEECHEIYHMLTVSALKRPEWDVKALYDAGFLDVVCDPGFGERIFREEDAFYIPDKMFSIRAVRPEE
ncbi:MAG: methyltransferase domain-containing protein [Lachnospiraceae bacterium]|nr:methyltransferase domain-containing protein [Lachnospiraceae bacterium]